MEERGDTFGDLILKFFCSRFLANIYLLVIAMGVVRIIEILEGK
jgi:hypothetical protein